MLQRLLIAAGFVAAMSAAFLVARAHESEISILQQLVPKIERAQELSPETKQIIESLLTKAQRRLDAATARDAENAKHRAIIQRVATALRPRINSISASGLERSTDTKPDVFREFSARK
jgi:hypothetical protein